jgi:D-alanyl-D-alanine carboxypeptidase
VGQRTSAGRRGSAVAASGRPPHFRPAGADGQLAFRVGARLVASRAVELQRTAGNRAVTTLASDHRNGSSPVVQRQPPGGRPTAPAPVHGPPAPAPAPNTNTKAPAPAPPEVIKAGGAPTTTGTAPKTVTFVKDWTKSAIDLLPKKEREKFQGITWGWFDFPGGRTWAKTLTADELALYRTDQSLVETESGDDSYFEGKHEADATALFAALTAAGAGERRVNSGADAVLVKEGFGLSKDAFDEFFVKQLIAVPGQSDIQMHSEAAATFVTMRDAAKVDGVTLTIGNAYRSRASEEATAKKNTNAVAFGGFSPHSMGLAVDLDLHVKGEKLNFGEQQTKMSTLPNMYKTSVFKWMFQQAAGFNFFQYRAEPWHWEYNPSGFKDRFFASSPDLQALATQGAEEAEENRTGKKAAAKKAAAAAAKKAAAAAAKK